MNSATSPTIASPFAVAAIQMISSPDVALNLRHAAAQIAAAAQAGAQLIVLPEYFCLMGRHEEDKVRACEPDLLQAPDANAPLQQFLAAQAKQHQCWLIGGTIPLASPDPQKVWNSVLVYSPEGARVCRYDKIHLFGFDNGRERYAEAQTIAPGHTPVVFDSPAGPIALSVCYDLRFPELYRQLGQAAPLSLIVVPAAFTYTTGEAHWEILLRARAIENQCYVLASAQGGQHENGRRTWGHSMLIDPWGEVIACLPSGEGHVLGLLEAEKLATIRTNLPALRHRCLF
ncbi:carbon-nitrogen hydrolase family protein [Parvibium lacunae]|uniref:Carbon-nitrogen hydrolase family protein n=1 Tax=Parvibium lacunae TaxID=1888893 RepID=A0A368L009_9BURK|nr:carbon-nitrogen hydrolase family protein [Parvibium lacunae]RCS56752.1 carbon-nitrogen hydrolase family protein [Parvibium lacunae]